MTEIVERLLARLLELADSQSSPRRYLVAYSGGRDSTVLLHALTRARDRHRLPIVAVHINHQLQASAENWQAHCRAQAESRGVDFIARTVSIDRTSGGLEAGARRARYAAMADMLQTGDWLLTAHHRDDQAETLLASLLRSSGVDGLAGIAASRPLGAGVLARPLLELSRAELAAYGQACGLDWVEDPSNDELSLERNFLRHEVLPLLTARWPAAAAGLAASARLAAEAAGLLRAQAREDASVAGHGGRVSIPALQRLSVARQCNLLRHAARAAALPPLPAAQLTEILSALVPARRDARPRVCWEGAEARRYRNYLYLLTPPGLPRASAKPCVPHAAYDLGADLGELSLTPADAAGGIESVVARAGLRVAFRRGGEALRPHGHARTQTLKKLFQQHAVVPWMRSRIPLLYAGETLVAVADLWIDTRYVAADGYAVRWRDRPALF